MFQRPGDEGTTPEERRPGWAGPGPSPGGESGRAASRREPGRRRVARTSPPRGHRPTRANQYLLAVLDFGWNGDPVVEAVLRFDADDDTMEDVLQILRRRVRRPDISTSAALEHAPNPRSAFAWTENALATVLRDTTDEARSVLKVIFDGCAATGTIAFDAVAEQTGRSGQSLGGILSSLGHALRKHHLDRHAFLGRDYRRRHSWSSQLQPGPEPPSWRTSGGGRGRWRWADRGSDLAPKGRPVRLPARHDRHPDGRPGGRGPAGGPEGGG